MKHFVGNSINMCRKKGKLSTSLTPSVIICILKGNKDRTLLKSWRPISLLGVVYKLNTTVIANRLKPQLAAYYFEKPDWIYKREGNRRGNKIGL